VSYLPEGKIAYKAVCRIVFFLTIGTVFLECRIKKPTPSDCFFGDFAHWVTERGIFMIIILQEKLILKLFEKKKRVTNVNYTFISI